MQSPIAVRLLSVGTPTAGGNVYDYETLLPHFGPEGAFSKRVKGGAVFGEVAVPTYGVEGTREARIVRVLTVDPQRIAFRIESVELTDDSVNGTIVPCGPYGHITSTSFSMRSIIALELDRRKIHDVITFDYAE